MSAASWCLLLVRLFVRFGTVRGNGEPSDPRRALAQPRQRFPDLRAVTRTPVHFDRAPFAVVGETKGPPEEVAIGGRHDDDPPTGRAPDDRPLRGLHRAAFPSFVVTGFPTLRAL